MKSQEIYSKAEINGIYYLTDCTAISEREHEKLMNGSTKANGKKIRMLIKKFAPDLYESLCLNFHNPYEHQSRKKQGMFIYVHSSIEYFLTIN